MMVEDKEILEVEQEKHCVHSCLFICVKNSIDYSKRRVWGHCV